MTNLKCIRSALGFVLAFFASTAGLPILFRGGGCFVYRTIFQPEQRVPTEQCQIEYVPAKQPRFDDKSQTPE